ncbi:MAG: acylphosphatase [Candidatus Bathyarchaeota archaeon]
MKTRARIIVSGRVQGVFFRDRTRAKAQEAGVTGWVRNLRNGRVEAVFEGEKEGVETMILFCKRGPPGALVREVEVRWETFTGEYKDFSVV